MKRTTLTIAALVVATIATGAAAPALAQDQAANDHRPRELHQRGPGGPQGFHMHRDSSPRDGMRLRLRGGGAVLALVCSENGADRLEHLLLNMKQRTDPTAEQQPLFDAFQSAALTAQTDFAAACLAARPAADASTDLVDRLKARLDVQQAHLDAMNAVLPSFEAFYDSLSDEQKQALAPRARDGKRFEHRMRGPAPATPQDG